MESRAGMNEVKFRVRQNALLWREFTVAQMVEITGLKPESVRTELQRMKQEGLLEAERDRSGTGVRRRGGQPVLYRLTSDSEKRLALSRSVEAFYPKAPRPQQPTSHHFVLATRLLDQASGERNTHKREQLLVESEDELDFALVEEGASRAPKTVAAHIEFQRGRVAYLRGCEEQAERLFHQARQALNDAGLAAEAALADEFLLCIRVHRRWMIEQDRGVQRQALCLLEELDDVGFHGGPLVRELVNLLNKMTEILPPSHDWLFAAVEQVKTVGQKIDRAVGVIERFSQQADSLSLETKRREQQTTWLGSEFAGLTSPPIDVSFFNPPRHLMFVAQDSVVEKTRKTHSGND